MNNLETAFYKAITDLQSFLDRLVLVGGWVPYIYKTYVWKDIIVTPRFTTDVDFGIPNNCKTSGKSIYQILSELQYPERHLKMDRLFPVVPQIQVGNNVPAVPLEFLCDHSFNMKRVLKLVGPEIQVNSLHHFDVVLSEIQIIPIPVRNVSIALRIPSEPIFVFHKLITFQLRDTTAKAAKDLYYAYYMLRYSPHVNGVLGRIHTYHTKPEWNMVQKGLRKFFDAEDSAGPMMIEQEFGPDSLTTNLRKHIFDTFRQLASPS